MRAALVCALILGMTGCTTSRMQPPISANAVVEFLHRFEAIAEKEDFALIEDMIHERAYFRFNDGDFIGRPAIKVAFEKAWRGDPITPSVPTTRPSTRRPADQVFAFSTQ